MVRDARKTTAKRARVRFEREICARSPKFSHERAAALPRVWRCESAGWACKSRGFGARRAQNDRMHRYKCARSPRLRCKICARSAKVLRERAAALPRVWRCKIALSACKSRDFGAVLVRDARKTTGKRARDRRACAAKLAPNRQKFCASAPQLYRSFGAAKAQFRRANRAISARSWCATRAK